MRTARTVLGVLMVVIGAVWLLQGAGMLRGSAMTGSSFWTIVGAVVGLAGIALLAGAAGRRAP